MSATLSIELTATQIRILGLTDTDQVNPKNPENLFFRFAEAWEERWAGTTIDNAYAEKIMIHVKEYMDSHKERLIPNQGYISGICVSTVTRYLNGVPQGLTNITELEARLARLFGEATVIVRNRTQGAAEFEFKYGAPNRNNQRNLFYIYGSFNISIALLNKDGVLVDLGGGLLQHDNIPEAQIKEYELESPFLTEGCQVCGKMKCVNNFASAYSMVRQMQTAISSRSPYKLLEEANANRQQAIATEKIFDPGDFLEPPSIGNAARIARIDARTIIAASNNDKNKLDLIASDVTTQIIRRAGKALSYFAIESARAYNADTVLGGILTRSDWLEPEIKRTFDGKGAGGFYFSEFTDSPILIGGAILARS